jgi:hypothetical protein
MRYLLFTFLAFGTMSLVLNISGNLTPLFAG